MNDLLGILERLVRHQVEFVLVGGQAAILHGATVVTRDVDVCIAFTDENLARLVAALAGLHPLHRMTPDRRPFILQAIDLGALKNLYLQTDLGVLDCLSEIAGVGAFETVKQRSVEVELPIGRCRVISLAALIASKSALNRVQDKLALIQLQAVSDRREL